MVERPATPARRVVAAVRDGRSVIVEDGPAPASAFDSVPGLTAGIMWRTAPLPSLGLTGDVPEAGNDILPKTGGTTFLVVTFPPDSFMTSDGFDPAAAGAEYVARLPGLAERFEPDNPGMHTTDTIDYDIVLDGEISIEFDDGAIVDLKRGDVVVQHGTRHAWRNRGTAPATMIFVLIGAARG